MCIKYIFSDSKSYSADDPAILVQLDAALARAQAAEDRADRLAFDLHEALYYNSELQLAVNQLRTESLLNLS